MAHDVSNLPLEMNGCVLEQSHPVISKSGHISGLVVCGIPWFKLRLMCMVNVT